MRASKFVLGAACAFAVAANAATIDLVPVASDCGGTINGNEITVTPGCNVEVEVQISGFAPDMVAAYQSTIDCASLDASVSGKVIVSNLDGTVGACSFGDGTCTGIDENNPRRLLTNAASTLPACSLVTNCPSGDPGEYACGSVAIFGDSGADDGMPYYGSTWGLAVSADFKGTAAVTVQNDPNNTFLKNPMARDIVIDGINPALITVPVGACCGAAGANLMCADGTTADECAGLGGSFNEGEACLGVDGDGDGLDDFCPVCMTDADCDDDNACTTDVCDLAGGSGCINTDTTPAGECCNPANGSLTTIDDGDDCTDDVCDAATGQVSNDPSAAGTMCDDGNGCTFDDQCDGAGACGGTDTNTAACTTIDDCPAGAQSCEGGFCVCTLETKLDLVVADSDKPDTNCFDEGDTVSVDVVMGAGSECVTGGQFLVNYDPSCLQFEGLAAGDFFPLLVYSDIDETAGTIFAAVGIMPGGDCTQGPEVLASLSFSKLGLCGECSLSYDSINPQNTILSNSDGNTVPLAFNDSKAIRLSGDITLDSPEGSIDVNPDCDSATAVVTWGDISASDSCDGSAPSIDCDSFHDGGVDISGLAANGGIFPQGISTFTCTATNSCGNTVTNEWTVNVSDQHSLDVKVQLSPIVVGDPITRCIQFAFYSDCVQAPNLFSVDLNFGFPYDFPGKWRGELKVPKGQYACITAKDPLHSLRSVSDIDCVDNQLVAEFKGDPTFDGNWLVQGNLDCWKADGNGDTIDILDFGMFVSQYLENLDPNTPCGTAGPHSDINGDGVVDSGDFAFISQNFLATSKNSCCEDASAAVAEQPILSITVKELRRRGLGELAVADLNNDGVVNVEDMTAFQDGETPARGTKRGADMGGVRNSLGR